jgi:hypothetical protein
MHESTKVFEDRISPGDRRVEKVDDGGIEVAIFAGPDARDRDLEYADRRTAEILRRWIYLLRGRARDRRVGDTRRCNALPGGLRRPHRHRFSRTEEAPRLSLKKRLKRSGGRAPSALIRVRG